ncbi:hypothetical protein Goklo_001032, partial [Gossypium klotzschianum]|nr:hypothetical protein [Gossypium klotzschianum]
MASLNTLIPIDDGFNEYESALKRQKSTTSKVWNEMKKFECENKNELKAQCNHCKNIFSAKSSDHVKEELAKTPGLICITSNNWNSWHTNDEYICITAHWVAKDWKLQKRIIRFRALFSPYNGLNIANELVLCLYQWGIDKKIFSITLDNASYNDVIGQRDKDYQIFALSNEEWRNVTILCKFLNVFYDVTCVVFCSSYPTVNLYFRGVRKVQKVLLDTVKDPHYKLNYVQYCFTTIYGIHASDFVETIISNLRLLFDMYVKKSKSMSSSLVGSSNVLDNNHVDSNLHQHNVNSADFGGDYNESDDYKRKSSIQHNELSILARDLLAIPISIVASESAFSMGKKVITPLRSSLKPKTVQAVAFFDDWMRAKGFST